MHSGCRLPASAAAVRGAASWSRSSRGRMAGGRTSGSVLAVSTAISGRGACAGFPSSGRRDGQEPGFTWKNGVLPKTPCLAPKMTGQLITEKKWELLREHPVPSPSCLGCCHDLRRGGLPGGFVGRYSPGADGFRHRPGRSLGAELPRQAHGFEGVASVAIDLDSHRATVSESVDLPVRWRPYLQAALLAATSLPEVHHDSLPRVDELLWAR